MKKEVNVSELVQQIRTMAEEGRLVCNNPSKQVMSQKDASNQIIGTIVDLALDTKFSNMKAEVEVEELIKAFDQMVERGTLMVDPGVKQEDLLIQIIGIVIFVANRESSLSQTEKKNEPIKGVKGMAYRKGSVYMQEETSTSTNNSR